MKTKLTALFLFATLAFTAQAQTLQDCFILGTTMDYSRQTSIKVDESQIDWYYSCEKPLVDYIRSCIDSQYGEGKSVLTSNVPTRYQLYSTAYFPIADGLYKQKSDAFKTKDQAYAYMHGVWLRHGRAVNDSIYAIRVYNSQHARVCNELAKKYGFANINMIEMKNNIPNVSYLFFTPTAEFLATVAPTHALKELQDEQTDKVYRKILGEEYYKTYKASIEKTYLKLLQQE